MPLKLWQLLEENWWELLGPAIVLALTLALGYAFKRLLFRALQAWTARTKSPGVAAFTGALRGPFMIWVLILGLHLATESSDLPPRAVQWVGTSLLALWIVSFTMVAVRLAGDLVRFYSTSSGSVLPVTGILQTLAQVSAAIFGVVLLLKEVFKTDISAILTALGVGGLAVALALQDTLSNLFSGFYVAVAGQVRVGDYIKLNTGEEGYISDIGWRSTTIRALSNNMIIVPNSKLGQAVVTNYHLPEKRMAISVQVGVGYDSDPDAIERMLLEEARRAAAEVPGLLAAPEPSVRFDPGFQDSSLGFTLNCHVAEFTDQYLVRHELRKRILKRFRAEGVDLPFPTRTVFMHGQGGA